MSEKDKTEDGQQRNGYFSWRIKGNPEGNTAGTEKAE